MGQRPYYQTVWAVMAFAWVTNYLVRVGLSPVLVPIMREFDLSYAQAGLLAAAFFYAYTFMQVPAGALGDGIGKKRILVAAPIWWGISSLLTGLAPSVSLLFVSRFLTGLGQGTYFGNDRPVIAAYTPPERMAFGQGVSFTGLGVGMALGIALAGLIADAWGWRWVFILFAVPAVVAGLVVWRTILEPPRGTPVGLPAWLWLLLLPFPLVFLLGLLGGSPLLRGLALAFPLAFLAGLLREHASLRRRDLWCVYLGGIAPIYCLWVVGIWAPAMFMELGVRGLGNSSVLSALLGVSAVPGLILLGSASDRLARAGLGRKGLAALTLVGMTGAMALMGMAVAARTHPLVLGGLIFAAGFCIWGVWAPVFALLAEITPVRLRGTSFGLNNTINFLGSLIAPVATGWIKDATGSFAGACYLAAGLGLAGALSLALVGPAFRWTPEGGPPEA